jgi:pimeloyl-ACP methyl ester carboxylesterase
LLLHGNSQNHATWYGVAARLAQDYHVILADLRGYGDSSLPDPGPASNLVDAQPLPTGHYLQEEAPDQVVDHFIKFFTT